MARSLLALAALLIGAPAFAHGTTIGEHGGVRFHLGAYHVELTPEGDVTALYVTASTDENEAASAEDVNARIAVGEADPVMFTYDEGNRMTADVALEGDWMAMVQIVGANDLLSQARFTAKQREALLARIAAGEDLSADHAH